MSTSCVSERSLKILASAPLTFVFDVLDDAIAALTTVRKAWNNPPLENQLFYVLVGVGSAITLPTISTRHPPDWLFAYTLAFCVLMTWILTLHRDEAGGDRTDSPDVLV